MNADFRKTTIRTILSVFLIISLFQITYSFVSIPEQQRIVVGQELKLGLDYPEQILQVLNVSVVSENGLVLDYEGNKFKEKVIGFQDEWPVATTTGTANVQLRIFGIVPIKNMVVDVIPEYQVVPGGQSIGVMLESEGILVVGFSPVNTQAGEIYPGKETGIKIGDIVVAANGKPVSDEESMAKIIDSSGRKQQLITLKIKRAEGIYDYAVKPQYCSQTERFRIGLLIRDNAAGVGTLTFYDPVSERYGALGHVVSNGPGEQKIDIKDGQIVESVIQGIEQGRKGKPGEKIGMFVHGTGLTGEIEKNTYSGIYGELTKLPMNNEQPVPVAFANEIKRGPAKIRTVVDGSRVEEFDIEILKVMPRQEASGKGMIIKITDKRLLATTGGIIQGMSGSPILQNGKLVGAVTHVFINEPSQGYGILAEWMLSDCGLIEKKYPQKDVSVESRRYLLPAVSL